MPYVKQVRNRETHLRKRVFRLATDGPGVNRLADGETTASGNPIRDTIYGFRSTGVSDAGNSLNYEDLSGEQLRREINSEGRRTSEYDNGHTAEISHDWVDRSGMYTTLAAYSGGSRIGSHSNYFYGVTPGKDFWSDYLPADPGWPSNTMFNNIGTGALNRFRPNQADLVNLLQSLVELRKDGLPRIPSLQALAVMSNNRTRLGSAIADEHLNSQFGIAPMISDLKGLAEVYLRGAETIQRWEKRSGIAVRRSGVISVDSKTTTGTSLMTLAFPRWISPYGYIDSTRPLHTNSIQAYSTWVDNTTTTIRFSGSFEYHLQQMSRIWGMKKLVAAERLLGLELTPETVWEVSAWSWLADWWSNFGSMLTWFTSAASDHMVLRYGYLMSDSHAVRSRTLRIPLLGGGTFPSVGNGNSTRYKRVRANPYGFGIDTSALTGRQWAILAALGMSRAPKVLRRND